MDELEKEAERATDLLGGKRVEKIFRNRSDEIVIQFVGGGRLFVDAKGKELELSITGLSD